MFRRPFVLSATLLSLLPSLAHAHPDHSHQGGFAAGWVHPLLGTDHLIAMLAVGLWGAMLGGRSLWGLPSVFLGSMLVGGLFAMTGLAVPGVEPLIIASMFVLGGSLLLAWRPQFWIGAGLVGAFAFFHGFAHAAEAPASGSFALYACGFLLATATLLAAGAAAGQLMRRATAIPLLRVSGAVVLLAAAWVTLG